jgi:hypothetical protein
MEDTLEDLEGEREVLGKLMRERMQERVVKKSGRRRHFERCKMDAVLLPGLSLETDLVEYDSSSR